MFGTTPLVHFTKARPFLQGDAPTVVPARYEASPHLPTPPVSEVEHTLPRITRVFSKHIAVVAILLSAIVYERDDDKVKRASELAQSAAFERSQLEARESTRNKLGLPPVDNTARKLELDHMWTEARTLLHESDERIRKQAKLWGLEYVALTDLASTTGPFVSLFYSRGDESQDSKPFICLVCKGTTPTNFSEFLVDASINRVTSRVFLGGGNAHEGFYESIFPVADSGVEDAGDAYDTIRLGIQRIAGKIKKGDHPVPLWITGHSLGSAMSNLIYMRFLKTPSDLGHHVVLRDNYSFGSPRSGDGDLASAFSELACQPIDRPNTMWRVVDDWDVVPRVPPGIADNESPRNKISESSVLNFAHYGAEVHLLPREHDAPRYELGLNTFHAATRVIIEGAQHEPTKHPSSRRRERERLTLRHSFKRASSSSTETLASMHAQRISALHTLADVLAGEHVGDFGKRLGKFVGATTGKAAPASASAGGVPAHERATPVDLIVALIPKPLHDHFPPKYYEALLKL